MLGIQGHSKSSMLTFLRSSSPVLVTISSMSVPRPYLQLFSRARASITIACISYGNSVCPSVLLSVGALNLQDWILKDWILTDQIAGVDFDEPGFWRTKFIIYKWSCMMTGQESERPTKSQGHNCLRHVCNRLRWKFEMSTHVTGIELCAGPPMLDERTYEQSCSRQHVRPLWSMQSAESNTSRISSLWTCKILHFLKRQTRCHGEWMSSLSQQNWHGSSTI